MSNSFSKGLRPKTVRLKRDPRACPNCNSTWIKRQQRNMLDRMRGIDWRFQCKKCHTVMLVCNNDPNAMDIAEPMPAEVETVQVPASRRQETVSTQPAFAPASASGSESLANTPAAAGESEPTPAAEQVAEQDEQIKPAVNGQAAPQSENNKTLDVLAKQQPAAVPRSEQYYILGCRYHLGRGVEQSTDRAMRCFVDAATSGHARAQYNLACYLQERVKQRPGTASSKKNTELATYWFRQAAKQGHEMAQNALKNIDKADDCKGIRLLDARYRVLQLLKSNEMLA